MYEELCLHKFEHGTISYNQTARIVSMKPKNISADAALVPTLTKRVVVVTAGTTDIPVAEEAAVTLEASSCEVESSL